MQKRLAILLSITSITLAACGPTYVECESAGGMLAALELPLELYRDPTLPYPHNLLVDWGRYNAAMDSLREKHPEWFDYYRTHETRKNKFHKSFD